MSEEGNDALETAWVLHNGAMFRGDKARVSAFDRGFLFGDAIFESLRTFCKKPHHLAAHLARLRFGASLVGFRTPWPDALFEDECAQLIRRIEAPDVYLRIMLTSGVGFGFDVTRTQEPERILMARPLELPEPRVYEEGISVLAMRMARPLEGTDALGAKVTNYVAATLGRRRAKVQGADDVLFLLPSHTRDEASWPKGPAHLLRRESEALFKGPPCIDLENDEVLEGATSNVFVLHDRVLATPPGDRVLLGITRNEVIRLALSLGLRVEERRLCMRELRQADELFLTSSIRGVVPVVRVLVGGQAMHVGGGRVGAWSRRLRRARDEATQHDV